MKDSPTSSFKARGLAMAVSMAKQLNLNHLAIPTNGNAGAALAHMPQSRYEIYCFLS